LISRREWLHTAAAIAAATTRPRAAVAGEAATISRGGGRFVSFIGQNAWFSPSARSLAGCR